jgi:hypothetical protein
VNQINEAASTARVPSREARSDAGADVPAPLPSAPALQTVDNPMSALLQKLESGELGDQLLSFDVLIVAFRRKMLLDACMAAPGSAAQS